MKLDLPQSSTLYSEYQKQDEFVLQNIRKENIPKAKNMIADFDLTYTLHQIIEENKENLEILSKEIQKYFQGREDYLKGIQKKFS